MDGTYASVFQIYHNIYDVKIDFSSIEPQLDDKGDVIGEMRVVRSRVTMSPAAAKELAQILSNVVAEYEGQYGRIPGKTDELNK